MLSRRLLQHIGHRLTQMCFNDGSSFFTLVSLYSLFLFPSICRGPLDKQVKNIVLSEFCERRDKIHGLKSISTTMEDARSVEIYRAT